MDAAEKLFLTFLVLAAAAMSVFLAVAWSTRLPEQAEDEVHRRGYVIRGRWFLFALLFLLAVFFGTLPFFPYLTAAAALQPAERVPVVAQQFAFIMPDQLPLNRRILFEVTSHDVNHGFGIYDPEGRLIAQTQAMPDYVNYLAVTFDQPGHYTARCLEFCGVAHAVMEKDFTVEGAPAKPATPPMSMPATNNIESTNGDSNPFE
jgi:cytochrome c oxidase subunit 2